MRRSTPNDQAEFLRNTYDFAIANLIRNRDQMDDGMKGCEVDSANAAARVLNEPERPEISLESFIA